MSFLQDIRYGLRMIVKAPAFTALAIFALALGVCANTTIFSLVNGILLRPLTGVKDPATLVALYTSDYSSGLYGASSYPDYIDLRQQADAFEDLAASELIERNSIGHTEAERLRGVIVTGNYFSVVGIKSQLGRTLQPGDEQPSNAQAVVISDGLWRRRFNANPNVLGQTLSLDGNPYSIVGVTDLSFRGTRLGLGPLPEFWIPMNTASHHATSGRDDRGIQITGRLKQDVTVEQAQTQLTTIAARLAQAYPKTNLGTLGRPNEPRPMTVVRESRVGPQAQGVWRVSTLLFIVVGLVLLIACANVANLVLARASVRRREMAVRLAVGASRRRLIRQLLTESLMLALLGGAAGLLVTQWTSGLLPKLFPDSEAAGLDLSTDWRVLIFTLGVSVLTAILFGLTPALYATRLNLLPSLKVDDKASGQGRHRLRDALVISQLALSLVLLITAALFVRSLQAAIGFDPGFAVQNLLIASLETQGANLSQQQGQSLYEQSLERIGGLPGVQAVTLSAVVPISGGGQRRFITLEGYQPQPNEDTELNTNVIGPNYFNTMGIPFVAGRDFNAEDREGGPLVVIVNEELARRYYSGNAVGKRLQIGTNTPFIEIVGVVRTVKYRSLREDPLPFIYIPLSQEYQPGMTLMVRAASDPASLAGVVRSEIRDINKDVTMFSVQTMSRHISDQISGNRMVAVLLSIFGGGALLLAAIGIYGVISYSVAQRTHEIGIRLALGAEQRDILKLIVGQGMVLVFVGAGIGLLLAFGVTWVLQGALFGVSATDPLTFTVVLVVLVGVALLACYLPARRATKVDPLVALRYE